VKTILSIDGGGIRGLIPAVVLAELERRLARPVASAFDLVAGTSTGGILALGLTLDRGDGRPRHSAADLVELYRERGPSIFRRNAWRRLRSGWGVLEERYSERGLERALEDYLGDAPLGAALVPTLVSTYDIQNRAPFFFKSWRPETRTVAVRRVARATSAAPTYFEPAVVEVAGSTRALIDGGVFVNNPAMSAYAEARRLFGDDDDLRVVSLGTGSLVRPIPVDEARTWGLGEWMAPILSVVFDGVSDAVDYQLRQILGERYLRLQVDLGAGSSGSDDIDDASPENLAALETDAVRLLATHRSEMERLVELLGPRP
jgi:patatin-like phospholipase/acyl hydrolase